MSKHLTTTARKNSPLMGRNLDQKQAVGGRPSALTSCVERENGRGKEERETERSTATTIIIIAI